MTNNFELIEPLLNFSDVNDFYIIELIQRRKENPSISRNLNIIKKYNITSLEKLKECMEEIIIFCNVSNCRAYIRLNRRNFKDLSLEVMVKTTELIRDGQYKALRKVHDKVAGNHHSEKVRKWIVDIDEPADVLRASTIIEYIETLGGEVYVEIPSLNGIHIITSPFRVDYFKKTYPDIEIHKDNPTNLYIP